MSTAQLKVRYMLLQGLKCNINLFKNTLAVHGNGSLAGLFRLHRLIESLNRGSEQLIIICVCILVLNK